MRGHTLKMTRNRNMMREGGRAEGLDISEWNLMREEGRRRGTRHIRERDQRLSPEKRGFPQEVAYEDMLEV